MNKKDLSKLKPGDLLRMKKGWGADGALVRVVKYPCAIPGVIIIHDGKRTYFRTIDALTFVGSENQNEVT